MVDCETTKAFQTNVTQIFDTVGPSTDQVLKIIVSKDKVKQDIFDAIGGSINFGKMRSRSRPQPDQTRAK